MLTAVCLLPPAVCLLLSAFRRAINGNIQRKTAARGSRLSVAYIGELNEGLRQAVIVGNCGDRETGKVHKNLSPTILFGFFDKTALAGVAHNGLVQLTVVGKLRSGQMFYGRDTVQVMEKGRER